MNCPAHYERALTVAGGRNPYGEPRFRLVWGETPIRRRNVTDELVGHRKKACWILSEWRPASDYPPHSWPDGLPYPASGRYEIVQSFYDEDGTPCRLDSDALNEKWLLMMVKLAMQHNPLDYAGHLRNFRAMQAEEERKRTDLIADVLQDSLPAFRDAASYALQASTQTVMQKKMEQIEALMKTGLPVLQNAKGHGSIRPSCP